MIIKILREQLQHTIEMNHFYQTMITDMRREIDDLRVVPSHSGRKAELPAIEKRGRVIQVEFGQVRD